MSDTIKFEGRKNQVIAQLSKYMEQKDAEKFFLSYFDQNRPSTRGNLTIPSINATAKLNTNLPQMRCVGFRLRKFTDKRTLTKVAGRNHHSLLSFSQIENSSFLLVNTATRKKHSKTFTKVAFIAAAVALDIALYCTLGFSFVGTSITAVTTVFNSFEKHEKNIALCITSVVEKKGFLPKYSSFRKSKCKNMYLKCNYHNEEKCNITKEVYVQVINYLVKQKILIIQ